MKRIKYIHCFGTSHTAGGGFEFGSNNPERNLLLNKYYSIPNEELSQYNFSYPGQLQKFIGKDVKVLNHAKQGYGDDRIQRILYSIVQEIDFNKDEHIFIIEFSGSGRQEIFVNELNKYLTINYEPEHFDSDTDINSIKTKLAGMAFSYFYDTMTEYEYINEHQPFFEKFVSEHINYKNEMFRISMLNDMLLAFLQKNNLNVFYTNKPFLMKTEISRDEYTKKGIMEFGDDIFFKKSNNILEFAGKNKMFITHETEGLYEDLHNSFKCNKLVAHIIYNKLVETNYLNLPAKPIDWEWYKNVNFVKEKLI